MLTSIMATLMSVMATLISTAQVEQTVLDQSFANQTPYGNVAQSTIKTPPRGYQLAFVETVGRHGARAVTSSARERRTLKIWQRAKKQDALTALGGGLADDVRAFQRPEQRIGYGNLSAIGTAEWQGIGRRTAGVYGPYLTAATARGDGVVFKTTSVQRTAQSADAMRAGLEAQVPGLRVGEYVTDTARLLIGNGASFEGNRATQEVLTSADVVGAAKHVLAGLYDAQFVDTIDDPVDAALDLYLLYSTAPGMAAESRVTFKRYVPIEDARVLAYAVDAENFYQFGPGVAGEDSSYRAARPLLDDFLTSLDERLAGGSTAAIFRLGHGETTMPFAALLGLPGSDQQAAARQTYAYDNNPWRGNVAGRLGGSVEWAAYTGKDGKALVTVRHNERPVELSARCTAVVPYFYRPAELRRCLG